MKPKNVLKKVLQATPKVTPTPLKAQKNVKSILKKNKIPESLRRKSKNISSNEGTGSANVSATSAQQTFIDPSLLNSTHDTTDSPLVKVSRLRTLTGAATQPLMSNIGSPTKKRKLKSTSISYGLDSSTDDSTVSEVKIQNTRLAKRRLESLDLPSVLFDQHQSESDDSVENRQPVSRKKLKLQQSEANLSASLFDNAKQPDIESNNNDVSANDSMLKASGYSFSSVIEPETAEKNIQQSIVTNSEVVETVNENVALKAGLASLDITASIFSLSKTVQTTTPSKKGLKTGLDSLDISASIFNSEQVEVQKNMSTNGGLSNSPKTNADVESDDLTLELEEALSPSPSNSSDVTPDLENVRSPKIQLQITHKAKQDLTSLFNETPRRSPRFIQRLHDKTIEISSDSSIIAEQRVKSAVTHESYSESTAKNISIRKSQGHKNSSVNSLNVINDRANEPSESTPENSPSTLSNMKSRQNISSKRTSRFKKNLTESLKEMDNSENQPTTENHLSPQQHFSVDSRNESATNLNTTSPSFSDKSINLRRSTRTNSVNHSNISSHISPLKTPNKRKVHIHSTNDKSNSSIHGSTNVTDKFGSKIYSPRSQQKNTLMSSLADPRNESATSPSLSDKSINVRQSSRTKSVNHSNVSSHISPLKTPSKRKVHFHSTNDKLNSSIHGSTNVTDKFGSEIYSPRSQQKNTLMSSLADPRNESALSPSLSDKSINVRRSPRTKNFNHSNVSSHISPVKTPNKREIHVHSTNDKSNSSIHGSANEIDKLQSKIYGTRSQQKDTHISSSLGSRIKSATNLNATSSLLPDKSINVRQSPRTKSVNHSNVSSHISPLKTPNKRKVHIHSTNDKSNSSIHGSTNVIDKFGSKIYSPRSQQKNTLISSSVASPESHSSHLKTGYSVEDVIQDFNDSNEPENIVLSERSQMRTPIPESSAVRPSTQVHSKLDKFLGKTNKKSYRQLTIQSMLNPVRSTVRPSLPKLNVISKPTSKVVKKRISKKDGFVVSSAVNKKVINHSAKHKVNRAALQATNEVVQQFICNLMSDWRLAAIGRNTPIMLNNVRRLMKKMELINSEEHMYQLMMEHLPSDMTEDIIPTLLPFGKKLPYK